ncbi:MAG: substrate-binding domain-containing protein [Anaerolineae bacterium]
MLRVYATTSTLPLINQLTTTYGQTNASVTFEIIGGNFESSYERLQADPHSYLFTNHLPSDPLWAAPIGQDGIAVIVHPDNPIQGLTTEQIRDLYRGRISNWQMLGGQPRPVAVFTREDGSGTRAEFERLVIGQNETTRSAQIAPSSAAMVDAVSRTPGAIGFVSASYVDTRVRALAVNGVSLSLTHVYDNTYPLRSFIYIAGYREPESYYRSFIYWVQSPAGQAVVGRLVAPLLRP